MSILARAINATVIRAEPTGPFQAFAQLLASAAREDCPAFMPHATLS